MGPWAAYSFSVVERDRERSRLTDIYHIAHIDDARRIVESGKIHARPVYDESILNTTRADIVWLSPVCWSDGSNYGTIRFHFDWTSIVNNKDIYWVEAVDYKNKAVRFLIREKNLPPAPWLTLLGKYDPVSEIGPLRKIGSEWYYASEYTLEILIECNLSLSDCVKIDAVKHHHQNCRLYKNGCIEFNREMSIPFAEFIGHIIGSKIHSADNTLTREEFSSGVSYYPNLQMPVLWLKNNLYKQVDFTGPVIHAEDVRQILRSACVQLGLGLGLDARNLVRMIGSRQVADQQLKLLIENHFEVPSKNLFPC